MTPGPSRPGEGHDPMRGGFFRWRWQRWRNGVPPRPPASALPHATPAVAYPHGSSELRVTWVGHSTFLLQLGSLNVLTDPMWSERASPISWAGPRRLTPPALAFDDLPSIDLVVLSHDHYDHLDRPTVKRLARAHPAAFWVTPTGYGRWLGGCGVSNVVELDWWEQSDIDTPNGAPRVTALPARHWSRRSPFVASPRGWAAFALEEHDVRVFFCGDSAAFDGFREIGARSPPFDALFLPIGAYEPRWFMRAAHMSPEEAVQAYRDLGGAGTFVAMHWGTFLLSDEPALEPPERTRRAWQAAGLAPEDLWIPRHGETRVLVPVSHTRE
jgi:N-acyl-phosphatidylethanolamine-hydrolysing phospholipase D